MATTNGDRRDSGIPVVGELPWGSHFCQFYKTQQDMIDIVVPYFRAGLENNELCIWVTSDFLTTHEALEALKRCVPGFPAYLAKKQIEVFPHTDWYLKGGASTSNGRSRCGWRSTTRRSREVSQDCASRATRTG